MELAGEMSNAWPIPRDSDITGLGCGSGSKSSPCTSTVQLSWRITDLKIYPLHTTLTASYMLLIFSPFVSSSDFTISVVIYN